MMRGLAPMGSLPPLVETHLVNAVLKNGARFYVDHAHPEISTPECVNALQIVRYDRSGEKILENAMSLANENLEPDEEIVVYKDNSDGKGIPMVAMRIISLTGLPVRRNYYTCNYSLCYKTNLHWFR